MVGYVGNLDRGPVDYAGGDVDAYTQLVDQANTASSDDELLNRGELEQFLEGLLGQDVTREQAEKLIKIYGNGDVVSTATIVEGMTKDGFLIPIVGENGIRWACNWDNIDGGLIADALFREAGLDPAIDRMTSGQFEAASKSLFGDGEGLSGDNPGFLTRLFGTANSLDRTALAGIYETDAIHIDGVAGEGYIRVFVNAKSDTSPFRDMGQASNYIMSFDKSGDGLIDREEFKAALESRLGNGITLSDANVDMYMTFYGFNHGSGARVLDRIGVDAMLSDTSLYICDRGSNGAQGFGINLNITPTSRVIASSAETDPGSLNDGIMSRDELVAMFKAFGLNVTPEQATMLLKVYGDGTYMTVGDVQRMQEDGFLATGAGLGEGASLTWDAIDGKLIAAAVFREVGVDPADPNARVTSDQFNSGVDSLFGDTQGQSLDDAVAQTRAVGVRGTLSVAEMGQVFDSASMHIDGVAGETYVRVATDVQASLPLTSDGISVYLMTFDSDGDGLLSPSEMETALKSWAGAGATLDAAMVERISRLYSAHGVDGKGGLSMGDLDLMVRDGVLTAGGEAGAGFRINLEAVPIERLIDRIFMLAGKDPEVDTLTARDFDEGTDHIFGDWKPVRGDSANQLASIFGTSVDGQPATMSWGEVYNIFASGAIQRGGIEDRTFLTIILDLDRARAWAAEDAEPLANPGRTPLGESGDPTETFLRRPRVKGSYVITDTYSDGTRVTMAYKGTNLGREVPLVDNFQARFLVQEVTIDVQGAGWSGQVTVALVDGTWQVTSRSPDLTVYLDPATGVLKVIDSSERERTFTLQQKGATSYGDRLPISDTFNMLRYAPLTNNPADDLAVQSVDYIGRSEVSGLTVDAYKVLLSDGTQKTVYVQNDGSRSAERSKELATALGAEYGRLPPELRAATASLPWVSVLDSELPVGLGAVDGKRTMLMVPDRMLESNAGFQGIYLHELGHVVDTDIPAPYWREAINADSGTPSLYSKSMPPEDFAETYYIWYMVRTGQVDPAKAADYEAKLANRFYLLDRSKSAVATLPPSARPIPEGGPSFTPFSGSNWYGT